MAISGPWGRPTSSPIAERQTLRALRLRYQPGGSFFFGPPRLGRPVPYAGAQHCQYSPGVATVPGSIRSGVRPLEWGEDTGNGEVWPCPCRKGARQAAPRYRGIGPSSAAKAAGRAPQEVGGK